MKKTIFQLIFFIFGWPGFLFANFQPPGEYNILGLTYGGTQKIYGVNEKSNFLEFEYGYQNYKSLYWYGFMFDTVYSFNKEAQILLGIDGALTFGGWISIGSTISLNLLYGYPSIIDAGLTVGGYSCFSFLCVKFKGNFYLDSGNSDFGGGIYLRFWLSRVSGSSTENG